MATPEEIADRAMTLAVELHRGSRYFDGTQLARESLTATADTIRDWLGGSALHPELADLLTRVTTLEGRMAVLDERIEELRTSVDQATNRVAARIQALQDRIENGEQIAADTLTPIIAELNALGSDPANPVPAPPPEPAPTP